MKPTIAQILEFGSEIVDKYHIYFLNSGEVSKTKPSKKYKYGVIYQVCIMYGYSPISISRVRGVCKREISKAISYLKNNSNNFEEEVNELKNSLDYIYKYTIFAQKKENLQSLYKESNSKLSFEDWLITRL